MDPIDLADDSSASEVIDVSEDSNDDVIEICEIRDHKNDAQYDHIFKESKLLGEFIEKCLDLENTNGMIRVINRSLIPSYYSTTKMFRESHLFTSIITKSICQLDSNPDHKFSHVKELCDLMKEKSKKLHQTHLNKIKYRKRKRIKNWHPIKKRRRNVNVIVSDDSDASSGFEVPIINLDEYASQENITNTPLQNRMDQDIEILDVEIDSIQDTGSNINQDLYNTNDLQDTLKNKIEDTESSKNNTKANTHKENEYTSLKTNVYSEQPQDNNSKPLARQSNKDYDTEISSTEISSTVQIDDHCDESIKGSQDSDLIVLDEDVKELVTTTQIVYEDTNNANNANENSHELNDFKGKEDKDLILLDEDNTHNIIPTQEISTANVKENVNASEVSFKENLSSFPALTGDKRSLCKLSVVNDFIVLDGERNETNNEELSQGRGNEKLNIVSVKDNHLIVIDDEDDPVKEVCNNNEVNITKSPIKLLVPHKAEEFKGTTEDMLLTKIKKIEMEIALYKTHVAVLEEQEVNYDTMWSPYIQCEKYKAKIVELYKMLCKLTGVRAVKRREVRLKASNMNSQLCVFKLEDLINRNIGHDGLPHFPDFQDVLQCVREANKEGHLGWNRNKIMSEANSLFTYCGRALQKSRMRREWRDMLTLIKSELVEDPADSDPDLMARLQANRQTAMKSEKDLLDRYCEMSYLPPSTECTQENNVAYDSDSDNETESEAEQDESNQETERNTTSLITNNTGTNQCTVTQYKEMEAVSKNLVEAVFKKPNANINVATEPDHAYAVVNEPNANINGVIKPHHASLVFNKSNINGVTKPHHANAVVNEPNGNGVPEHHHAKDSPKITILGSHVTKKRCTPILLDGRKPVGSIFDNSTPTANVTSNNDPKNILNHNFALITKVVLQRFDLPNNVNLNVAKYPPLTNSYSIQKENDTCESDNTPLVGEIKTEPSVKLQNELDKLGNDFTATVIDIEDPFLVVEISSDSEDEDS